MTTSLERPARAQLPEYPSRVVCNEQELADEYVQQRAVLTLRAAVDRDMLAFAVDKGTCGDESDPDGWPVEFTRDAAEHELAMSGTYGIWRDRHLIATAADDPEAGPRVRAIYRAVDRAYPEVKA